MAPGAAFAVTVVGVGCAVHVRAYLTDGVSVTESDLPDGAELATVTLFPIAHMAGTWHLYAEVTDVGGLVHRTQVVRVVTVGP